MNIDSSKFSRQRYQSFLRETRHINGWLDYEDYIVFVAIHEFQQSFKCSSARNVLEIGCFEGKSAIAIGERLNINETLHLCDVFENATTEKNRIENQLSYGRVIQERLENNLLKHCSSPIKIWGTESKNLSNLDLPKSLRLIHVDGSHLYENVKIDIETSLQFMDKCCGIVIFDDYQRFHTIGVAAALWASYAKGDLRPILATFSKIYFVGREFSLDVAHLENGLRNLELSYFVDFLGEDCYFRIKRHNITEAKLTKLIRRIEKVFKREK